MPRAAWEAHRNGRTRVLAMFALLSIREAKYEATPNQETTKNTGFSKSRVSSVSIIELTGSFS
jgi:hypothetical protein